MAFAWASHLHSAIETHSYYLSMTTLPLLPLASLQIIITPLWLLSLGVTAAVLVLALVYGLIRLTSRRATETINVAARDGLLTPLVYLAGVFVLLAFSATTTMPWREALDSIQRLATVGTTVVPDQTIPPGAEDHPVAVEFRASELVRYDIRSDQDLWISAEKGRAYVAPEITVLGNEPYEWDPAKKYPRVFQEEVTTLYVTNESDLPATLQFRYTTEVEMPEVHHLPIVFATVLGIVAVYFLCLTLVPGLATVAIGTAKEAISRPLFTLLLVVGGVLITVLVVIPANTFGEDIKPYTETCLTAIMLLGIVFALLTASTTVSDEIEGKTALTMLSKPVSRRQFVLGKFAGIVWPLLVMFLILGTILLFWISVKVDYDAGEASKGDPAWQLCYSTMMSAVPGLVLAFFATVTFTAISVAISTRLAMLPNLIICFTIYVIGNLLPQVVQSSAGELPAVSFTGKLLAVVLPVLNHFNIAPAIAAGQPVEYQYILLAAAYCLLYSTAAMLMALFFFEDRDLA